MGARGIIGAAVYVPHRRLDRAGIAGVAGTGGGKGTRSVAGYDEDTTTMAVEAARLLRRSAPAPPPDALWFSTTTPAYADKANVNAIHAALRLPPHVAAFDAVGSVRSSMGALFAATTGRGTHLVVSADLRTGAPGGPDESTFGDGAAAVLVGDEDDAPMLAAVIGSGRSTEEFLDR